MGFNAGSASAANGVAALALINTNAAAASALMTWVVLDAIRGSVSITGACIGPVVGLVAITPACGFVQPGWGLLIGIIGALFVYGAIQFKKYLKVDDALDVAVCHGLGGTVGAFCTGLFTQKSMNPLGGADGSFYGRPIQLWYQIAAILTAIAFAAACTAGILLPMKLVYDIRVSSEDEMVGLDRAAHGESWEAFASLAAKSLVEKMKEDGASPDGTFEMQYQPTNLTDKSVSVKVAVIGALPRFALPVLKEPEGWSATNPKPVKIDMDEKTPKLVKIDMNEKKDSHNEHHSVITKM